MTSSQQAERTTLRRGTALGRVPGHRPPLALARRDVRVHGPRRCQIRGGIVPNRGQQGWVSRSRVPPRRDLRAGVVRPRLDLAGHSAQQLAGVAVVQGPAF